MNYRLPCIYFVSIGLILILIHGCATTSNTSSSPKKSYNSSKWTAPKNVSMKKVYDAVIEAGTQTGFTIYKKDKAAGTISMKKQESKEVAQKKQNSSTSNAVTYDIFNNQEVSGNQITVERRMIVHLKKVKGNVIVSSSISLYNAGIVDQALGGIVNKTLTDKFYRNLFLELAIDDPTQQNIVYDSAN